MLFRSDDFSDEIDGWVIDAFKNVGCVTAKSILKTPREVLLEKTDLEENTIDDVLATPLSFFSDLNPRNDAFQTACP